MMNDIRNNQEYVALMDRDTDHEEERKDEETEDVNNYSDYYEMVAKSKAIRPICVSEGINFHLMSNWNKTCWWSKAGLQMLSVIVLSVRTDRLWESVYLSRHKLHYGGMLLLVLVSWCPQVIATLGLRKFFIEPETAYALCIILNFNYFVSISLFFWYLGPWLRVKLGTARTLRIWEYYVSCAWLGQTIAFWVLTITTPVLEEYWTSFPTWATNLLGISLLIFGIGSKMGAIYGTGFNTYYWYDMVTNIPNAYFVEVGIYKYVSSPTYTLGRGTSFGAAFISRSIPMFGAAFLDLALVNLFNYYVEQPSVKKMYGSQSK